MLAHPHQQILNQVLRKGRWRTLALTHFDLEGDGGDVQDELQCYLKTPKEVLPTDEANVAFDVLAWWRMNELMYPTLACMAFELFSIPSMSAEVERVFSRYYLENRN